MTTRAIPISMDIGPSLVPHLYRQVIRSISWCAESRLFTLIELHEICIELLPWVEFYSVGKFGAANFFKLVQETRNTYSGH